MIVAIGLENDSDLFGRFTNYDLVYLAAATGIAFILLFSRRGMNQQYLAASRVWILQQSSYLLCSVRPRAATDEEVMWISHPMSCGLFCVSLLGSI